MGSLGLKNVGCRRQIPPRCGPAEPGFRAADGRRDPNGLLCKAKPAKRSSKPSESIRAQLKAPQTPRARGGKEETAGSVAPTEPGAQTPKAGASPSSASGSGPLLSRSFLSARRQPPPIGAKAQQRSLSTGIEAALLPTNPRGEGRNPGAQSSAGLSLCPASRLGGG